jgi:hypothetical protein
VSKDDNEVPLMNAVAIAFAQYIPKHFKSAFCRVEQAPKHADGRLQYSIGSDQFPDDTTSEPSRELHEAAEQLRRYWARDKWGFLGLELRIKENATGGRGLVLDVLNPDAEPRTDDESEQLWESTYREREEFFTKQLGPVPEEIQKLINLTGVWPGGGLLQIVGERMGGIGISTSCGLTNVDMPTRLTVSDSEPPVKKGSTVSCTSKVAIRTPRWIPPEHAGYGYEIMVLTPRPANWPLLPVGLLVQMEILQDVDLLGRIKQLGGITVESLGIGDGANADFLITAALDPLPPLAQLPNGTMQLFVATRITREEMTFGQEHGGPALLQRLIDGGVGQMSVLERESVPL